MIQEFNGSKKIILLGLILLIIAGIVVVALKGFNVSLMLEQHEAVNIVIGKEININDMKNICNEVFKDKKVVVRTVDLFNDSVNISLEAITDEEKSELVNKINEKYGTEITVEELTVSSISNVRIRDLVRPYIKPIVISVVIIVAYLIIAFRKMKTFEVLGKIFLIILLTEATLASIIAIIRIPMSPVIVNLMAVIAVIELLIYINRTLKKYNKVEE